MYILNAFSLQMVKDFPCSIDVEEVKELPNGLDSAIGHEDTARVLGYPCNRVSISLAKGESAYVAQLIGGRLPEGCTCLPEGYTFRYMKVSIR